MPCDKEALPVMRRLALARLGGYLARLDLPACFWRCSSHILRIINPDYASPVAPGRSAIRPVNGPLQIRNWPETRAAYPKREFILEISGDTDGEWDKVCIAKYSQICSAMLYNTASTKRLLSSL
jgi:hypothetical protein